MTNINGFLQRIVFAIGKGNLLNDFSVGGTFRVFGSNVFSSWTLRFVLAKYALHSC